MKYVLKGVLSFVFLGASVASAQSYLTGEEIGTESVSVNSVSSEYEIISYGGTFTAPSIFHHLTGGTPDLRVKWSSNCESILGGKPAMNFNKQSSLAETKAHLTAAYGVPQNMVESIDWAQWKYELQSWSVSCTTRVNNDLACNWRGYCKVPKIADNKQIISYEGTFTTSIFDFLTLSNPNPDPGTGRLLKPARSWASRCQDREGWDKGIDIYADVSVDEFKNQVKAWWGLTPQQIARIDAKNEWQYWKDELTNFVVSCTTRVGEEHMCDWGVYCGVPMESDRQMVSYGGFFSPTTDYHLTHGTDTLQKRWASTCRAFGMEPGFDGFKGMSDAEVRNIIVNGMGIPAHKVTDVGLWRDELQSWVAGCDSHINDSTFCNWRIYCEAPREANTQIISFEGYFEGSATNGGIYQHLTNGTGELQQKWASGCQSMPGWDAGIDLYKDMSLADFKQTRSGWGLTPEQIKRVDGEWKDELRNWNVSCDTRVGGMNICNWGVFCKATTDTVSGKVRITNMNNRSQLMGETKSAFNVRGVTAGF